MRFSSLFVISFASVSIFLAGCSTSGFEGAPTVRRTLPDMLGGRFVPPEFATRQIDGERAAVLDASVASANALGYAVGRFEGASGRISASRRQVSAFEGTRQSTLEITVSSFAPGISQVALVLREEVEAAGRSEGAGAFEGASLVRDRMPYDVFFEHLGTALRKEADSAASPAPL